MGVGGQLHAPATLTSEERLDTPCTGGWLGLRVGLDGCGQSGPHRGSTPDSTARSESLYRMRHPGRLYKYDSHKHGLCAQTASARWFSRADFSGTAGKKR